MQAGKIWEVSRSVFHALSFSKVLDFRVPPDKVLQLIHATGPERRKEWYQLIYDQMQRGLQSGEAASIHGSLLVLGELLHHI